MRIVPFLATLLVFLAFLIIVLPDRDLPRIPRLLLSISPLLLSFLFLLAILEFLLQTFRIWLFLRSVPLSRVVYLYSAGQFLSFIAPSRLVGEAGKGLLFRDHAGVPYSRIMAAISVERMQDALALATFLFLSASFLHPFFILFAFSIPLLFFLNLRFPFLLPLLMKIPFDPLREFISEFFAHGREFLDTRFLISLFFTFLLWLLDFLRFFLILSAFGVKISFLQTVAVTCVAYASVFVSFLPGGLVFFEGSALGLLILLGAPRTPALLATLVERFFSFWLWLLVGFPLYLRNPVKLSVRDKL